MLQRFRHRGLGVAPLACLAAWLGVGCAPPGPPDVLLIVVDTLRADRLGSYGYQYPSPAMDALAEDSLRFENAFAQVPRTAPSLASLFTSLLPSHHGLTRYGASLGPEPVTLAEAFGRGGYETGLVSASADVLDPKSGLTRGFDRVEVGKSVPAERTPASDPALVRDRIITMQAIEQLDAPREKPLFLVVHYLGPHPPYDAKKRDKRAGTRNYRGPVDGSLSQLAQAARGELELDILDRVHVSGLYDAKVQGVDEQLGILLDHLRNAGRLDDMLVVLLGDHGEALRGDGGFFHGTTLYREQLRVPLLVQRPDGEGAGEHVSRPVGLVDVGPTLLELAGLRDERDSDGRSLAHVQDEPTEADATPAGVVSELPADPAWAAVWGPERHRAAVSGERWALLVGAKHGTLELYDVQEDPLQETDLAAQRPEVVEALLGALPAADRPRDAEAAGS
jgi:arylsulfatase A-like enzyme